MSSAFLKINVRQCKVAQDSSLYCIQVPVQLVFVLRCFVERTGVFSVEKNISYKFCN